MQDEQQLDNRAATSHRTVRAAKHATAAPVGGVIRCSVKKLVDFSCRSGDLESFGTAGPTAAEGQKAHQLLQSKKSAEEESEVRVSCSVAAHSRTLKISGRIDLVNLDPEAPCASEIKSCYAPPHKLPQHKVNLHWAQLKVYGYCLLSDSNNRELKQNKITLRLIWYNLRADEVTVDEQVFEFDQLQQFVYEAAVRYIEWTNLLESQFAATITSAQNLNFPHPEFRAGQRDMAAATYLAARDGFHLMCEAPTGVGKTVSTLFPAMKAIGSGSIDRVIYLTAKNSGRQAANECMEKMTEHGLSISTITITSKKTTCHCSNGTCERNAEDGSCPLTRGFFDRLPDARLQLIKSGMITPDNIDDAAHEYALCPFELTLQLLPWVQLVICDFNYVFDPLVRLSALTEHTNRQLLLVDETHNLTDRARAMYSATLDKRELKKAIADLDSTSLQSKNLKSLVRAIDRWSKQQQDLESAHLEKPKPISRAIKRCVQSMTEDSEQPVKITEALAEAGKSLFRYAVIEDLYDKHHRCVTLKQAHKKYNNTVISLRCLNATDHLKRSFEHYRSTVAFSATLRPPQFYRTALGLPQDTRQLSLESPFDPDQQCTVVCNWVDTRYKSRANSIASIVEIIASVYFAKAGNYQVFFPSYVFMQSVAEKFSEKHPDVAIITQKRNFTEQERHEFLANFKQHKAVLGFSILGGIFGEGVDYAGDQLIGSIIVGTGLASINLTQQLIETDFRSRGVNGFDYASRNPGFTRVLQTAGRVIRNENDRGVVVLVDQRFNDDFYHNHFPAHWRASSCVNLEQMKSKLDNFWLDIERNFPPVDAGASHQ